MTMALRAHPGYLHEGNINLMSMAPPKKQASLNIKLPPPLPPLQTATSALPPPTLYRPSAHPPPTLHPPSPNPPESHPLSFTTFTPLRGHLVQQMPTATRYPPPILRARYREMGEERGGRREEEERGERREGRGERREERGGRRDERGEEERGEMGEGRVERGEERGERNDRSASRKARLRVLIRSPPPPAP